MNVGEGKAVNVYQENNSKSVSKKHYFEESITPARRSTRIRKSYKPIDACNQEVEKFDEVLPNFDIPKEILVKPTNASSSDGGSENSSVLNINKDFEVGNTLFQGDNGEEESFESMFDGIFEQTYSKTLQTLLPKKSSNDLANERKFCKAKESLKLSYVCNKANIPTEDVNKVFKIISKPNALSNIKTEPKSPIKPLKTYSNKRKSFQKADVVESFGLPDHPITLENVQPLNKELDVASEDENEITVLDMEFVSEPCIFPAEAEDRVPVFEEIRTKSDPVYYPFMKNASFFDFDFIDPTILTMPYNSQISSKDLIPNNTGINTIDKNKEIDIEAIKINFKKILCKNDLPESHEQVQVKKSRHVTSRKKKQVTKNIRPVNNDISFVENNSLTVDNEEFEFSNDLIVPESSNIDQSKHMSKDFRNNKEIKITKKKLRSATSTEGKGGIERNKTVLKTTPRKHKLISVTDIKESADDELPKKISGTDNLVSNLVCNLKSYNVRAKSASREQNVKTVQENQETVRGRHVTKRTLRSDNLRPVEVNDCSIQNKPDNSTNEKRKADINHTEISDMADAEAVKIYTKSTNISPSQTELLKNKNPLEKTLETKGNRKNKKNRRSSSQDLVNTFHQLKNNIICTTDMKVSLQKCDFKGDFNSSKTETTCDTLSREILQKKNIEKLLSPLKKAKKAIPEIMIILKPLDPKLFENSKEKLRLTKTVSNQPKSNESENHSNKPNVNNKCQESALVQEEINKRESENDEKLMEKKELSQFETKVVETANSVDSCNTILDDKVENAVIKHKLSSEIKPCNIQLNDIDGTTKKSENSDITHINASTTVSEKNKDLAVSTKPKSIKKTTVVSDKLCDSMSSPLLNSDNKNTVKNDTEIEKTLSGLWEKEEDKPMVDTSLSTTHLDNPTKILDDSIGSLSKKNMLREIINLEVPECNKLIVTSDETKTDSEEENKTNFDSSFGKTLKENDDTPNYSNIQETADEEPQDQELDSVATSVQNTIKAGNIFEEQQTDKEVPVEKKNTNNDVILPTESRVSNQTTLEINLDTKQENVQKEIKSNIENTVTNIKNKDQGKLEKIDKQSGCSARLKEKRNKILGVKPVSAEESLKKSEELVTNKLINPGENIEKSTAAKCTDGKDMEQPVVRKPGRPRTRKPDTENVSVTQIQTKPNPRGRPKKISLDDMNLLNKSKGCHNDRTIRSKSVSRSMLEMERKPNGLNMWEASKDFISYHTRSKDFKVDDTGLQSRLQEYKSQEKNSKIKVTPTPKINTVNRNLVSERDTKTKINKKVPESSIKENIYTKKNQFIVTAPNASVDDIAGNEGFRVGDIAWAQIGSHPFWPCLVTKEPGTGYYKKTFQGKRFRRELYHVRFFGDKGRRAWINKQQIILYSNSKDLKNLQAKMKAEGKPIPPGYIVKTKALQKWECAVEEIEQLKLKNTREKLSFFSDPSKISKPKETRVSDLSENTSISTKRKSNENHGNKEKCSVPLPVEEADREKTQPQKKYKKNVLNEHKTLTLDDTPQQDDFENAAQVENAEESNQQIENVLSRIFLRRQIDENSEISSKTSSDNTTDTSLNCMEMQKALYKRNNLFRGVSRDKVCQYCFKPCDVLKCKGRCNGSFHVSCSLKILQEESPKRGRERHSKNKNPVDILSNTENTNVSGVNPECLNPIMKIEMYKGDDCKSGATQEEQVQIITVPSSVYNTPPRKTFPPDFKNMTLAEQIDYKMKEIMKKFEAKTFYSESSSDSSSEELLGKQVAIIGPNNASYIGIKKNDIEFKLSTHEISKGDISKMPNNMERLIAGRKIEKKLMPLAKKKLFIRHVTADSENLKSDFVQDETKTQDDIKLSTDDDESFESSKILDPKNFKCGFCMEDMYPYCFICHLGVSKKGSSIRQKCSIYQCGRFYHPDCLKMWPQTQWSLIQTTRHKDSDKDMDSFVCPLHVCHTCVSDDPRAATSRCSGDKIVKCLRCPSTYHSSNLCVPAGTAILSSSQIVCPRHREKGKFYTINTTWCFLCSAGGNLICCETCPTSVHPECLPVNLTDDDKFICEDCESGRLPLYDEIVWVKLGKFRWWPALILFPNEIPDNIRRMKHSIGEFVVKFFGTYDYYWVNRGRSFLFQEGDTGQCNTVKKKVDAAFNTAVEEAVVAHKLKKEFKLSQEVESITSLKPPPYIRIKVNKPVGNVRHLDLDLSSTNACECDPNKPHPCGPESDCLNRLLLTECNPEVCPAGKRCKNQSFEKREYPPLVPYKTQGRGWGLKTLAPIKKGQFVIEYVGELIDSEEYQRRLQKMHEQKEGNYYFLTIDKDRMIDAGPKGNVARFMNHCCQPNCETQKWTVNGDTRVGLFATEDIAVDTELTFNYNLECVGKEKKVCRCGAPNCSGFIGVKAKHDTDMKRPKKSVKRKVPVEPIILPPCFVCGKMENVISCNNKICNKTYHQECLKMTEPVEGNKFICPWHNCNICAKRTIRCCVKCINSYCPSHSDGNVRYDNLLGFVCTNHDPMTSPNDISPIKHKRKKSDVVTEESAVSSTTSDDADDDEDWTPLLIRLKRSNHTKHSTSTSVESESDNDSNVAKPLKKISQCSGHESQEEGAVSSATASDVGEEVVIKRKRRRPKKRDQLEKKIRLDSVQKTGITASSSPVDDKLIDHSSSSELTSRHNELEDR